MNTYVSQPQDLGRVSPFDLPEVSTPIDSLVAEYEAEKSAIERVAAIMHSSDMRQALPYFLEGNSPSNSLASRRVSETLFQADGAIKALDSRYWSKAIALTDVLEVMPQARRGEWGEMIRDHKTPVFEREAVISTLMDLLASRERYFAERIDGIFRALSGNHVTNQPQGFYKRMIMNDAVDQFGFTVHGTCGHIADLRCVIARFMGRDEPGINSGSRIVAIANKRLGEWHSVDGGSLRIKVYKKGTAHLEVHEDLAWRLNAMLATMYPGALPPQARTPQKARKKTFPLKEHYLPQQILDMMMEAMARHSTKGSVVTMPYCPEKTASIKELGHIMESLGGRSSQCSSKYEFDYDPTSVLESIILAGHIPDDISHQFYATSRALASQVADEADIQEGMSILEPSAGTGSLAQHLPKGQTTCVEVSPLRCSILKGLGFDDVHTADFLEWSEGPHRFDRVVMNPPFSKGRALLHLDAAGRCLKDGGRLVAILPASLKGKTLLEGFNLKWSEILEDQFVGTSVRVVILTADKRTCHQ